jgi:predicted MFS family arabinose efflux permease
VEAAAAVRPRGHLAVPGSARRATGRGALSTAFITLLVVGTDLFIVSPLLPEIARHYRVSPGLAGVSVTAFSAAYVVGAPSLGTLADRTGRRVTVVTGLAGFAVANLLTGLAPWFALLLCARIGAGLAAAAVSPALFALVGQSAPAQRRGAWMSTAVAGFLISLTTGAPAGVGVAAVLGWRAPFLGIGSLALVLAAVNWFAWRATPAAAQPQAAVTGPRVRLISRIFAVMATCLWGFSVYGLYTYLGTGLRADARFSPGLVATALFVYGAGAVAGSLSGGRLGDRYSMARVAPISLAVLSGLELLVDAALRGPPAVLLVALGIFALTAYPFLPAYQSRLVAAFPRHSGSLLAWNSSAMYLGIGLSAAVGGGLLNGVGFWAIPVTGACAGIVGAIVCRRESGPHLGYLPRHSMNQPFLLYPH